MSLTLDNRVHRYLGNRWSKRQNLPDPVRRIAEIKAEIDEKNKKYGHGPQCSHCGKPNSMIAQYSGGEGEMYGFFSYGSISPKKFYKCTACGNMQEDDGSHWYSASDQEEKEGIQHFFGQDYTEEYYYYAYPGMGLIGDFFSLLPVFIMLAIALVTMFIVFHVVIK